MTEMEKLIRLLKVANIPHEISNHLYGTMQVSYPCNDYDKRVCDAVCFPGSYGFEAGLLEIMGLVDEEEVGDSVEGWLTAEEVFNRISCHWQDTNT